ncbi:hypothetical protein AURDEDRAFT_174983 [Auricularia subglabra TFB-10046 SS5]|uniref:Uncharacterized protein n=1 Tax=Auricularia subglabra (strain TFB-10046 / SS5) TaxID=717982 RepID=J0WSD9_AURST|nr:hypothetical protein AURDEDRAFT_174983 [Auricularia subglabra TFB-10046 SS5]
MVLLRTPLQNRPDQEQPTTRAGPILTLGIPLPHRSVHHPSDRRPVAATIPQPSGDHYRRYQDRTPTPSANKSSHTPASTFTRRPRRTRRCIPAPPLGMSDAVSAHGPQPAGDHVATALIYRHRSMTVPPITVTTPLSDILAHRVRCRWSIGPSLRPWRSEGRPRSRLPYA